MNKKILAVTVSVVLIGSVLAPLSLQQQAEAGHNVNHLPASSIQQIFLQLLEQDRLHGLIIDLLTSEEFGLEEIKMEVIDIQSDVTEIDGKVEDVLVKLEDKPTIVCDSESIEDEQIVDIIINATSPFKLNSVYVKVTDTADGNKIRYFLNEVTADGNTYGLNVALTATESGPHDIELLRMESQDSLLDISLSEITGEEVVIGVFDDADFDATVIACAWIAQVDKGSFDVTIEEET
jgi:hypothetical protein